MFCEEDPFLKNHGEEFSVLIVCPRVEGGLLREAFCVSSIGYETKDCRAKDSNALSIFHRIELRTKGFYAGEITAQVRFKIGEGRHRLFSATMKRR